MLLEFLISKQYCLAIFINTINKDFCVIVRDNVASGHVSFPTTRWVRMVVRVRVGMMMVRRRIGTRVMMRVSV